MSDRKHRILTQEQLETFQNDGVLVIPNILSPQEIQTSKEELHRTLLQYGVDVDNLELTGRNLVKLSSTNGSGGVLDLFYPNFKLNIATNEALFRATCELWEANFITQSSNKGNEEEDDSPEFEWMRHPFGNFDSTKGYAYIDRIGFRLPTSMAEQIGQSIQQNEGGEGLKKKKKKKSKLAIQRSLTPHLDCCPDTIMSPSKSKWRPIQCFVSLTDNEQPNTGGFEAVRGGFHREFHKWASRRQKTIITKNDLEITEVPPPCIGEYTHIRPREDADIMRRIEHIPVTAGSAVLWDNRIPHANSYKNNSNSPRIVVYCSFLPDVEVNRIYAKKQLEDYNLGRIPRDQWIQRESDTNIESDSVIAKSETAIGESAAATYEEFHDTMYRFSALGRKLMMIEKW